MAVRKDLSFRPEPSAPPPSIQSGPAALTASNNANFHIIQPDSDDNDNGSTVSSTTPPHAAHADAATYPKPECVITALHPTATRDAAPWPDPNKTFVIALYTPDSPSPARALALTKGDLRLVPLSTRTAHQGSWYWRCVEDDNGWLGEWEYVCLRRCPGGGYVMDLLENLRLLKVAEKGVMEEEEDGGLVLVGDGEGEAVVWEFVEVGC
ncbi:hypothetical protein MFIFM68171_07392 [Madurella fahalii]|uniref:Uncharacterized protein n=1 Tax=Madurella fahalii TaxID=1157608 RepID=A0ABQ0GHD9_9PEZI